MNNQTYQCLRCNEPLAYQLSWKQIWSFQPIEWPVCCSECWGKFRRCQKENSCQYCQHPIRNTDELICLDCQNWLKKYDKKYLIHHSIFQYNHFFKEWIRDYKYIGDIRQGWVMKSVIQLYYQQYQDYIWTYLPSSPCNFERRGFNQIEEILKYANIPYQTLFTYSDTQQQVSQAQKNRQQRLHLQQPFQLTHKDLKGKKILILDDVYTTGTTLIRAKEKLFQQPIEACQSITLARDILV